MQNLSQNQTNIPKNKIDTNLEERPKTESFLSNISIFYCCNNSSKIQIAIILKKCY